jgi:hypothetical protein
VYYLLVIMVVITVSRMVPNLDLVFMSNWVCVHSINYVTYSRFLVFIRVA